MDPLNPAPLNRANHFLQKLIEPPLEQTDLLLSDQVKVWKATNQARVVLRAEELVAEKNINTKKLPIKVLASLLQYASWEEDAALQEKWAALLANTADVKTSLENPLYGYLLQQLTREDAEFFAFAANHCITVHTEETNGLTATIITPNRALNTKGLNKMFPHIGISLDNLLRLRLLKELSPDPNRSPVVLLTDLGFNFMEAIDLRETP